jgi:hypothetical protein
MNAKNFSAPVLTGVPHLQDFLQQHLKSLLQQQLIQASRWRRVRRALQIHCSVDWERALISIDLSTPVELDPQDVFAVLEKLIQKTIFESDDFKQDFTVPGLLSITRQRRMTLTPYPLQSLSLPLEQ